MNLIVDTIDTAFIVDIYQIILSLTLHAHRPKEALGARTGAGRRCRSPLHMAWRTSLSAWWVRGRRDMDASG